MQVRLLRVLQEGTFTPVGASREVQVDVRLITATHRNLMADVAQGNFREDLFYRVAVGVLHLPALREREGDLQLLTDALLAGIGSQDPSLKGKKVSLEAKELIQRHPWRGNVRELHATLLRAALWCRDSLITQGDIDQALFKLPTHDNDLMAMDVSQGLDINHIISKVVSHYVRGALLATGQNKTRAAALLGLKSQQTLSKWMEKHCVE